MVLLLAEALQELFFPWVEASAGILAHLATTSPHEDVRSYAMAGWCITQLSIAIVYSFKASFTTAYTSPR
jgi:hypothetical protein